MTPHAGKLYRDCGTKSFGRRQDFQDSQPEKPVEDGTGRRLCDGYRTEEEGNSSPRLYCIQHEKPIHEFNLPRIANPVIAALVLRCRFAGRPARSTGIRELPVLGDERRRFVYRMKDRERNNPKLFPELEAFRARVERLETLVGHILKRLAEPGLEVDIRGQPFGMNSDPLTAREVQVLRCVASGMSNLEIAAELRLAIGTIKRHVSNICDKLQVNNRTRAVARARSLGLL